MRSVLQTLLISCRRKRSNFPRGLLSVLCSVTQDVERADSAGLDQISLVSVCVVDNDRNQTSGASLML